MITYDSNNNVKMNIAENCIVEKFAVVLSSSLT